MPYQKSESTKAKDAARMKEKFTHLGYTAKKEEAEAFKTWCAAHEITPSAALRRYVLSCIAQDPQKTRENPSQTRENVPED